ncbi:MAG: HD-like signal output (HDOD) protein [Pseudohongiellaceae bacterium]|jgi:HD-like signal output (HDOD) protein
MKGLNGWMRVLESSQAAVLSTLLTELDRITAAADSSGMQLAAVILKDSSLTSSILRVSNSVFYNPSDVPVTTVSRAVINIGFKNIRSVCMSLKVLEAVLKDRPSPMLVSMLAKTLHGATQAKALCNDLNQTAQEEVFVASLLSHLAELLVLGSSDDEVKMMIKEVNSESTDELKNRAAEKRLGVSITRLSKTLMKQWRIEGVVHEVLSKPEEPEKTVEAVMLGDEISRAALFGWNSLEFLDVMKRVADFKGITVKEAQALTISTADETAKSIKEFGRGTLTEFIPSSTHTVARQVDKHKKPQILLEPNADVQLKILQEITELLMGDFNINTVFKNILNGIHKGVGVERVTLVIFDKSHQKLVAKYVVGKGTEKWGERFILRYERSLSGFLYNLFENDQAIWIGGSENKKITQLLTSEYQGITGQKDFFIAPLSAQGKRVGVIYADMGLSSRPLDKSYFSGYSQLIQQAKLALNILANK